MARILIAGCGDVGTALGQRLHAAGHNVWGITRHAGHLPAGIQPLVANVTDAASLSILPPALDAVVYSVAATDFSASAYHAAYVAGVQTVLAALRAQNHPIQRLIFTSSTSVYGQQDGQWVDENDPADAVGFSADCLRAGEQLMWESGWPAVVVRFGGIYGPGRTRLIDSVRSGEARRPIRSPLYTNRIHRDDCARVLAHLLFMENPAPLYVAVDDDPAPLGDVLAWLAEQLGMPALLLPATETPVKPGAETRRDVALRQRANKRCRNARLRASGFDFQYPSYRDGYAALLRAIP